LWGPTHSVNHREHLLSGIEVEVVEDGLRQRVGDLVGAHHSRALGAGLAVDPDPQLDLVVAQIEGRLAFLGVTHEVSAVPMVPTLSTTFSATRLTSERSAPSAAFAPAGLVDEDRPADAAPAGGVQRVLDGDVVVDHDALDLDAPSISASSMAVSKFITSPS